jgi:hypothetical protein
VVKTLGKPSAFDCSSIGNLPDKDMDSAFASRDPLTTEPSFRADRLGRGQRCLCATLSSGFNPALPAFSRTPFGAKDVAIEDPTCAGGR